MLGNLFVHPYTRELRKTAQLLEPSDQTRQRILNGVLAGAGIAATVSFCAVMASSASVARLARLKSVGSITATVVEVSAVGVAGAAIIVPPGIENIYIDRASWHEAAIVIEVSTVLPASVLVTPEGGEPLEATRRSDGSYEAVVSQNGSYRVEVSGQGDRSAVINIVVQGLDIEIPQMQSYSFEGNRVAIYFTDADSGVAWDAIYAVDSSGSTLLPVEVNRDTGYAVFEMSGQVLNVYVQDIAGNCALCAIQVEN